MTDAPAILVLAMRVCRGRRSPWASASCCSGCRGAIRASVGAYAFRPLLLPGLALLWPLVLWRWVRG